jgi:hypothetical protein
LLHTIGSHQSSKIFWTSFCVVDRTFLCKHGDINKQSDL